MSSNDARSGKRARLAQRLSALSAACGLLYGSPAEAQGNDFWNFGAGIFVGYAFGTHSGFTVGGEAFATYVFDEISCGPANARHGLGPLLQVSSMGAKSLLVTLAAQGGRELTPDYLSFSGELGVTQRFGAQPGTGVHTGVLVAPLIFDFGWRSEWGLDQMSAVAGVRFAPTFGVPQGGCIVGRPLRTSTGFARVPPLARRLSAARRRVHRAENAVRAGRQWEVDAQHECASIPAFLQLAAELLAHDAPERLVARALDAACDEMVHAAVCANVASQYLGERVWPVLPAGEPRLVLRSGTSMKRIAAESWLDGCLGEGAAAARAARSGASATDPLARATKTLIAADEHRHAELGWSIVAWAADRGGDTVRDAVRTLRNVDAFEEVGNEDPLARYGCLGSAESQQVGERHFEACRRRLDATL
jgi:hypothetical protein